MKISRKVDRAVSIIMMLMTRELMTHEAMGKILGANRQTITRDIDGIIRSGFPLTVKQGVTGGVKISDDFKKNNSALLTADTASLVLALTNMYPKLFEIDDKYIVDKHKNLNSAQTGGKPGKNIPALANVTIRFHESHMADIEDRYFFSDIAYEKDGLCTAQIKIQDSQNEYDKLLLLGNKLRCLEPRHIREYIENKIKEINKIYG